MKRKLKRFSNVFWLILAIVTWSYNISNIVQNINDNKIRCTNEIVENVTLLSEYVVTCDEKGCGGTTGVATFETNGKIYLYGHSISNEIGNLVYKIKSSFDKEIIVSSSDLIGRVIANEEEGVIAEEYQKNREYKTIPIAKKIRLGEAYILARDEKGNFQKFTVNITNFQESEDFFYYTSSEVQFKKGMSGMPIVQNDELIGVHYGSNEDKTVGIGRIIWNLDLVLR